MDIRVAFVSYLINTTVCTAVLGFLWKQTHQHNRGIGLWVASSGLSLLAVTLIGLRNIAPALISILAGNLILLMANLVLYIGLERFLGKTSSQTHNIALLAVFLLIQSTFTYVTDNLSIRTINFSAALIAINLQMVWLLYYRVEPAVRVVTRGVATTFLVAIGVSVVRIAAEVAMPSDNNLLNASDFQIVVLLTYQVIVLILAFGLSLMVNQQLFNELRTDIAQRKHVESELRDSDARIKAILSAIPDLMFRLSRDGIHLDFYAPDPGTLFVSADEFIGKSVRDVLPEDVGEAYQQRITACLTSGEPQTFEYALTFDREDLHHYEARMVPINADEVLTIVRDISIRKRTEAELAEHRENLEELVSQRTQELQSANEELVRLSRAKDDFVSNVSHELRTPLTNLVLRQQLIKMYPEKLETYLNVMERETQRLGKIIEDLLDLSRLDQSQVDLELQEIDLNELVGHYINDRAEMATTRGLSLVFAHQVDQALVQADEGLIGQVLSILLTNAMNYTPAGGRIQASTSEARNGDRRRVGFRIVDSGPGISDEDMPQLFERFFRGEAALESGAAGTGLGLALARQIVEQHGGTIEVVSQADVDEGACFTVWLPAGAED